MNQVSEVGSHDSESGTAARRYSAEVTTEELAPDLTAAAFFDIDNTMMRGSSIFHLARGLYARKILTSTDISGFAWKAMKFAFSGHENLDDMASVTEAALELVKGRHVDEMRELGDGIYEEYMVNKLWPGTVALAQAHLDSGQRVWLVSATPIEIAEVIAERLGLSGAIATKSEQVNGRYTGRLAGPTMHGQVKADAVAELAAAQGLDLARCSAYSDSENDIPMLSLVGHPCAVNPDHKLRVHARTYGWQVRDFRGNRRVWTIGVPSAAAVGFAVGLGAGITATHFHHKASLVKT